MIQEEMLFKGISYLELWQPFFVQRSITISAILVKGIIKNNCVKLFWIYATGSGFGV